VKCGAALTATAEPKRDDSRAAERRQLTVMFCDLVGATAVSTMLDPEEMRELIRAYQDACAKVIARFEGHVAQYLGDGLLVYFGYPQAHEDDPRRAVRAALEIAEAIERANLRPRPDATERLAVRVGVHTGIVVVGEIGDARRHEHLALGETPNLAARLQELAAPGTVAVSDATHRLAESAFHWSDLGARTVKGFTQAQRVWRPIRELGRSRLAPADAPLIGRDGEMSLLRQRWEQAQRGDGQVVLLTGEPGIGKSRIAETFLDETRATTLRWLCSPYYQNTALYPFAAHIEQAAATAGDEPPAQRLDKLERWLDVSGGTRDSAPLFAALLSIPFAERYGELDLTPPAQREKTLRALEEHVTRLAARQSLLGVLEDVHWLDPTSRTLLDRLVELVPRLRMLLLVTARPDFSASWARLPHVTVLTLNHLGRTEATRLVAQIARGQSLAPALIDGIVERAEGIPLYVEEITKATLERHDERDPGDRIPATLRDSLTGRLDRLGWVKEVAQAAAVIGREFDDELLASITTVPDERRHDALQQLSRAQLVVERRHPARTVHYFRHALIQEAAYQSLLNVTRRGYHKRIAEAMEVRFPERAQSEPETLAQHFTEAGDDARAITYWIRAGQRGAQRSANLEAVEHLRKGQQLLDRRPAGQERDELELSLLIALGPALMATRGWNAPEVEVVYARARVLAAERGRSTDVFPAVWGRWLVAHAGGQAQVAREYLAEIFALLRDTSDTHLLLQAHHAGASTTCTDGELDASLAHLEALRALYRLEEHREQALVYGGHDPCVCALSMGGLVQLMRGDFRRSRTLSDEARALAARVGHVPSVAHAALYRAELSHILGDVSRAEANAHDVLAIGSEKGLAHYTAWAQMFLAWAMVKRGHVDAGLAKMDEGVAALRATGNQYHIPQRLTLRVEALAAAGRTGAAQAAADEALEAVARTGEVWYEPEVLRVKGQLLQAADTAAAEQCFEQAVAVARARRARFWEVRAAAALAALQAARGRVDSARSVLGTALRAFDDARDLGEIADAVALLDQLKR
jgi:class 3 adenylate cyclase/predicted ATPase